MGCMCNNKAQSNESVVYILLAPFSGSLPAFMFFSVCVCVCMCVCVCVCVCVEILPEIYTT